MMMMLHCRRGGGVASGRVKQMMMLLHCRRGGGVASGRVKQMMLLLLLLLLSHQQTHS
jgi:hypothetical protein